jgi:RimJ/RimL family protein N-acetyltransferase/catechol 2,3-dioxygenase-like lactoylglutathione lyase family enzyme
VRLLRMIADEIVTERLRLRPFTAEDLPAFVAYRSAPGVARYQSWDTMYAMADAERFLAEQDGVELGAPGAWVQLAAVDRADGRLRGDCAVRVADDQPATAEVGVTFAPEAQGSGLATEALSAVVDALFARFDLHRVYAETDDRNVAVHRLLARVGFREEARLVEADWFKGEWTTVRVFGLLRREWPVARVQTRVPTGATGALRSDAVGTASNADPTEVTMSTTDITAATVVPATATVPTRFEVTTLPVADVDRAKAFYLSLGWRLDIDFEPAPGLRGVQMTPPGSQASIQFGKGTNTMEPGSLQGLFLVVDDIVAMREDLMKRGVEVSEIWHLDRSKGRVEGMDPKRTSYANRATFADPDGNTWILQEITERLPGRVEAPDSAGLAQLLQETALRHGAFEAVAAPHDWWDWYGAYMAARQEGSTPDDAAASAGRYMRDVKGVS